MVTAIKGNDTSTFGGNIDVTGNVITDAPAFSAILSGNFDISASTWTKIAFATEEFDTNSNYDNATNYRFTPNVAGYYQCMWAGRFIGTVNSHFAALYKNGIEVKASYDSDNKLAPTPFISALIYMNGTTDYLEAYCLHGGSGTQTLSETATKTYFQGYLARAV